MALLLKKPTGKLVQLCQPLRLYFLLIAEESGAQRGEMIGPQLHK